MLNLNWFPSIPSKNDVMPDIGINTKNKNRVYYAYSGLKYQ